MARRIVMLDSERGELEDVGRAFQRAAGTGSELSVVTTLEALLLRVGTGQVDLVLVDQELGSGVETGFGVLVKVRELDARVPVVMLAAEGDVDSAARAIDAGATDFLVRGQRIEKRAQTQIGKVKNVLKLVDENRALVSENRELRLAASERFAIIGGSQQMRAMSALVERVAKVPRPVLVVGERGTGKELVARALHEKSAPRGPFLVVNCAAVADSLLESELFGHERGAFTGAERMVRGKFELASDGTLFLDEIGNMSLAFQQKILRVVEYGSFVRVGGSAELSARTRIVAATNSDLKAKIARGEFLPDLYDRLAFEVIRVPPLRERSGDVERLAEHFLQRFMREVPGFSGKTLSPSALAALGSYPFPGNVRELKNIIERAVYRETNSELTPEDLDLPHEPVAKMAAGTFKASLEALERELVRDALERSKGNQAEAARLLGLPYHQFRYYCAKHTRDEEP